MKNIILFISIAVSSGLTMVNIYNSVIDTKSWGSEIPNSISVAREYFKTVNPGDFFRKVSPLNQVLGLLVLILFWKLSTTVRLYLGMAFVLYVLGDVLTFAYFYPRNEILFRSIPMADVDTLKRLYTEWCNMNWIRSLIGIVGLIFSCFALHKAYMLK